MRPDLMFGGIYQIYLGDIMQLKPCKGKWIWQEPKNSDFVLAYYIKSHWHQFTTIILEKNHRQGQDGRYANILNRIRVHHQTKEDINILRSRVRPEGSEDLKMQYIFVALTKRFKSKISEN